MSRRTRLLHTESFRAAYWFALLFLGLSGALVVTTYWIVDAAERTALLDGIDDDIQAIRDDWREQGRTGAVRIVRQMAERQSQNDRKDALHIVLADRQRHALAGDVSPVPDTVGAFSMRLTPAGATPRRPGMQLLGIGAQVGDDLYVFAGRDMRPLIATRRQILMAFMWVALASVVLAAGCGVLFGLQSMRRIDEFTRTCEAVIGGSFADRVALRGNSGELDRLAAVINHMLDRISALLDNLRQVSSDIAHDLRTPLTHLRQRLEAALYQSRTPAEYARAVGHAIDDTDQLLGLFNALLRISQIEAGTRASTFRDVDLSHLLRELCDMYRPVIEDHRQSLSSAIAPGLRARGDPELLSLMCVNVIENAIRHTRAGTTVDVALLETPQSLDIVFRDDGPGIPEHEYAHVFKRFYRVVGSRTSPGNGLGLALVAAVVDLHRARVSLSDARPGLQVTISLPRAQA